MEKNLSPLEKKEIKQNVEEALNLWREQKREIIKLEEQDRKEQFKQQQLKELREKEFKVERVHSRTIKEPVMPAFETENEVNIGERILISSEPDIKVSPSIYLDIKGHTLLKDLLDMKKDSQDTFLINKYILQKMNILKLADSKEGYEKVFDELLEKVNLTRLHQKNYIIQKILLHLRNRKNIEDDLVFSVMANREKVNARFR